ncbi:hypothetical protein HMPREF0262_01980 [Clostridium sp. ATCC 29733]|nr:hypothetical protein HMPREF0262_01980 [Clostridium sp. ATCC 29733]
MAAASILVHLYAPGDTIIPEAAGFSHLTKKSLYGIMWGKKIVCVFVLKKSPFDRHKKSQFGQKPSGSLCLFYRIFCERKTIICKSI